MATFCVVTIDNNGGSATPASGDTPATPDVLYVDGEAGGVYLSYEGGVFSDEVPSRITIPTWAGHTFKGYYDKPNGGTGYTSQNGYIVYSKFAAIDCGTTPTLTLYAHWEENYYRVTISRQGGTGGTTRLYYDKANRGFYTTTALTTRATEIELPTRECFAINNGFYSEPDGAGSKLINSNGTIPAATQSMEFTGDVTIYANWKRISYKVTLDWNNGKDNDAGTARTALYFRVATGGDLPANRIYGDDQCGTLVTGFSTRLPQRDGYSFAGYRANADGTGTLYVNSGGQVQDALKQPSTAFSANFTIYADWTQNSYVIKLVKQGGTGGRSKLYNKINTAEVYTDIALTVAYSNSNPITTPEQTGYSFAGYWTKANKQGNKYINANGKPTDGNSGPIFSQQSKDISLYAGWTANDYVLTFSANGGTIPGQQTDEVNVQVTYNAAIGNVFPSNPTRVGYLFSGWYIGKKKLTATTKYTWATNKTAEARWATLFGNVVDWFDLTAYSNSPLVPIRSDAGMSSMRVDNFNGSSQGGPLLMNPTVTYAVKGQASGISVTLGKAFVADTGGYMITSVTINTAAGQPPTVTVQGVANEGADAINTYPVSIWLSPRSKAQNLWTAIVLANNQFLTACNLTASCDPVVVFENLIPVASDVVHGKVEISGEVVDTAGSVAPSANTFNGFEVVTLADTGDHEKYHQYSITVRKDL